MTQDFFTYPKPTSSQVLKFMGIGDDIWIKLLIDFEPALGSGQGFLSEGTVRKTCSPEQVDIILLCRKSLTTCHPNTTNPDEDLFLLNDFKC